MVAQICAEAPGQQSAALPQAPPLGTQEAALAGVGMARVAITGRAAAALPQRAKNSRRLVRLATGRFPRVDRFRVTGMSRISRVKPDYPGYHKRF